MNNRMFFVLAALYAGCGDTAKESDETSDSGSPSQAEIEQDVRQKWVTLSGLVLGHNKLLGLADATVRAADRMDIEPTSTDADGRFSLNVPENTEVTVLIEAAEHLPVASRVISVGTESIELGRLTALPQAVASLVLMNAGVQLDAANGLVSIQFLDEKDEGIEGVTAQLSPMSGDIRYANAMFLPDAQLSATSKAGLVNIFNVTPGAVELTFGAAALRCTDTIVPGLNPEATAKIRIFPNTVTNLGRWKCAP